MWALWNGRTWVEVGEEYVEEARNLGYECRQLPVEKQLGEYDPDCTKFPTYVEEGILVMERYLAAL